MTERKRILLEKDNNILNDILQSLTNSSSASISEEDIQRAVTKALAFLHAGKVSPVAVSIITEALRLSAPKNILGPVDLSLYFESILALLPCYHLNLAPLVKYRIAALLKDNIIIAAYFEAYSKITLNKEHFEAMLAIFVEENESSRQFIVKLLELKPVPKSFISKVFHFIDIQLLSEEQYIKLFEASASCMTSANLRIVTGRNRIHFVRSAISIFKSEISHAYVNDRNVSIRSIIAANNPEPEIFARLLHDPAEEVRTSLLEPLNWEKACTMKISDRIVDKSFKVREILFRIYREGVLRLYDSPIFDKRVSTSVEQGNFSLFASGTLSGLAKTIEGTETDIGPNELEILKSFIYKLFEGCLTYYRDEFIKVLRDSRFSLGFLHESRNMPGVAEYLDTLESNEYIEIPEEYRGFYLEYIFKGEITDSEIRNYLSNNVFEVLKHIRVPEKYYEILLEKAKTCESIDFIEDIVQKIKHILETRQFIGDIFEQTISANVLFINAHTICPNEFVEKQLQNEPNYPRLYFLVHQARTNEPMREVFCNANVSDSQRIFLLLYLNDPRYLCEYSNFLLEHPLSFRVRSRILAAKTVTSSLIYFLSTGKVAIKNSLFFLLCMRVAAHCKAPDGVKRIFLKYILSVEQAVFDMFYSICYELKNYAIGEQDGTYESISQENKENSSAVCDLHKLRLKFKNKMLYFICDLVMGQRQATLCEVTVDFTKHGFIRLSASNVELVRHGRVIYE